MSKNSNPIPTHPMAVGLSCYDARLFVHAQVCVHIQEILARQSSRVRLPPQFPKASALSQALLVARDHRAEQAGQRTQMAGMRAVPAGGEQMDVRSLRASECEFVLARCQKKGATAAVC